MATNAQKFKELAKRLREEGQNANIDDLIDFTSGDNLENSRQSRDLLEQFTGSEMMKNTSLPIDFKNDKAAKKTLEGLTSQYTDIMSPEWDIYDIGKDTVGGLHTDGTFGANKRYLNKDVAGQLVAHEPIHKMVRDSGGSSIPDDIMNKLKLDIMKEKGISGGLDLAKRGALEAHEVMQAGHLNPNAKVTSSLRNAIAAATGKFGKLAKSVPLVGPALAGGLTMMATGDASAAGQAATPILNEAESLGPEVNSLEAMVEDPTKSYEQRQKAIQQLSQRRD
jgi:hypothetical protein